MVRDLIEELLLGRYRDPEGGVSIDPIVKSIVIDDDLSGREAALVADLGFGDRLAVVSDAITHGVLGRRIERALGGEFSVQSVVLGDEPHADDDTLRRLVAELAASTDALVAVGSGTINDLCKAAAGKIGRPYAVFGTAPSMNGYASATASISVDGLKRSFAAGAPRGVFLDVAVLAGAPRRMIRAGLAEGLCRSTAQSDWLLAHLLVEQSYCEAPFDLLRDDEQALVDRASGLIAGDFESVTSLARVLVLSGIGMTICGSSRSSSQGEHLISHYIDMTRPEGESAPYHGEQIAVTTLFMAELQGRILDRDEPLQVRPSSVGRDQLIARMGTILGEHCWNEYEAKRITAARVDHFNERLRAIWGDLRQRIGAVARPAEELRATLAQVGAAMHPGELGWSDERYREACIHSREIRNRFTFLDLAVDAGVALFHS